MKHRLSQQHKLFQKMVLTPQMRLSIKLLGMSTNDLNEYIDHAIEQNPFLKKMVSKKSSQQHTGGAPYEYFEGYHAEEINPRLSLLSQLRISGLSGKEMNMAEQLLSELDDNGYIQVDIDEFARDVFASLEEAEVVLKAIQGLDPPGIGARDVRECLQIQLSRSGKGNSLEYSMVSGFLTELARNDIEAMSKALGVSEDSVREAIDNIKKLNPRPASTMLSEKPKPVVPDMVARVGGEKIRLEINREYLPHLRLYNPYENKLAIVKDPETRKFMKENMDSARHLIDNLKRREETMCKVADFILGFHKNEVANGVEEIKSLTIKDISTALNMHPSTVNRTVSNKYIEVNDKVVPLKSLLSHGIKKENGEVTSKITIKKKIEAIVGAENKAKPLSDKAVQETLAGEGIVIQRRTVAKYRESLRILPTHLRKKK